MYNVIVLETGLAVLQSRIIGAPCANDGPAVFPTADAANECARNLTDQYGTKHIARPVVDLTWKRREQSLFDAGTYQYLPWHGESWFETNYNRNHFAHYSLNDPAMIAYVPDEKSGQINRHVRLRAGAYLQRFFKNCLTSDQIRDKATAFNAQSEALTLHLAKTPDEIEHVYCNGPSSCMDGRMRRGMDSSIHPTRVYGAGDLAVAYVRSGTHISARVVCWPDKKIYSTIYGDRVRMERILAAHEYCYNSGRLFDGARLLRIEEKGGFVLPYVDTPNWIKIETDCLRLSYETTGLSSNGTTVGLAFERHQVVCDECGEYVGDDDTYIVYTNSRYHSQTWCRECADNNAAYCDHEGCYVHCDFVVNMANGEIWSPWRFEARGVECDQTGDMIPRARSRTVQTEYGVRVWRDDIDVSVALNRDNEPTYYDPDYVTEIDGRLFGNDTDTVASYNQTMARLNAVIDNVNNQK